MTTFRSLLRGAPATASKGPSSPSTPTQPQETAPLDGPKATAPNSAIQQEFSDIEDAMAAAELIMNDNIEGAEARFRSRNATSSFHQLGLGVTTFMTSILGFEKDVMAEAGVRLSETESRSWDDLKKAQKEAQKSAAGWFGRGSAAADAGTSSIYPPGSEFALVNAESQLMNAVVAVMHESLTEGIKGFYKLRKAFLTLDAIMEAETKYVNRIRNGSVPRPATARRPRLSADMMPGSFDEAEFTEFEERRESDSDGEFADARSIQRPHTPSSESTSHSRTPSLDNISQNTTPASKQCESIPALSHHSPASADLFTSPVDIFIHSGANMCFGILLLIVSMVPPAFSRLLYILGFKGDRDRGVKMLWESTQARNVNGAIAGLVLLGYYNGLLGFADILPEARDVAELAGPDEIVGYPRERCGALLAAMTARYPDSRLWKLQEARELANNGRLDEAVAMLAANEDSKMRQIAALNAFELGLNTMFTMRWTEMRDGFLRCLELNKWSHSVYYYLLGCAELEMYRDARRRERELAAVETVEGPTELVEVLTGMRRHKKAAEEYFRKAPSVAGRKKFLAKQMPFEVFVIRKVQKWEERAAALGLDLADVPVVSPAMEMVYLWNGSKRMTGDLLKKARGYLDLNRCTMAVGQRERVMAEEKDEMAIWAVAEAALLRSLGRTDEAREVLAPVMSMDKNIFKGPTRDDYALPGAHYEMAAAAWRDACDSTKWPTSKGSEAVEAYRRQKTEECMAYLEKNAKWETYVLDGRFGMRVQAGIDSVKWLKGKKGW
ncbi:hypothetical protein CONLIGDRAFT_644950 [Coniochaeta ligniaria NRRL 30616]|uniref:Inclusion body clearance protein IML2 n=1 Tax=Coniochaeta ligniaria NRRL 30616 TaxID=1408157 RepID=A0A1J7IN31_9PEZI|nr:hypothetical protein CONLIGDRAFT_644950 [Coniochaeta ligniaria NRRL 30616]